MSFAWPDEECTLKVKEVITACVGEVSHIVDPTPLSAALLIAAIRLQAKHSETQLKEEEFTSALAGIFMGNIPWLSLLFPTIHMPGFDHATYSKSSRDSKSESATGADFAILIHLPNGQARVAVFQAKICNKNGSLSIHQMAPARDGKTPQPQLLRLAEYGNNICSKLTKENCLDWVHYCGYSETSSFCIPLSNIPLIIESVSEHDKSISAELRAEIDAESEATRAIILSLAEKKWAGKKSQDLVREKDTIDLAQLLSLGAAVQPGFKAPGWLTLESGQVGEFTKTTSDVMPILSVHSGSPPESGMNIEPSVTTVVDSVNTATKGYANTVKEGITKIKSARTGMTL